MSLSWNHNAREVSYLRLKPDDDLPAHAGRPTDEDHYGGWVSGSCPDGDIPRLTREGEFAALRELFPAWEISRDDDAGVWYAERRDGTMVHVLAAFEGWELAVKIRDAMRLTLIK
jgi:hypothetical protein